MEFKPNGTRQGKPSVLLSNESMLPSWEIMKPLVSFTELYITMLRRYNIGEAYVMMNIKTPESTVEWFKTPWQSNQRGTSDSIWIFPV